MVMEYITPISAFVVIIVYYFDLGSTNEKGSQYARTIGNFLFRSYKQTVLLYVICISGIIIHPISLTLPTVLINPFVIVVDFILVGCVLSLAILFAKTREKRLANSSRNFSRFFGQYASNPCFLEMIQLLSKSGESGKIDSTDLGMFIKSDELLETLVEKAIELDMSNECIDEILWKSFFDRFEETEFHKREKSLFSRNEFQRYIKSKEHLQNRTDSVSQVFQESYSRWSQQNSTSV